ncbi:RNA methyltransferase [Nesterenkonia natronophila]|uniref:RNA methyltransferase n=2 Tax=Nesterenkonia natronophila TaxID=2174932 RepID=A0A3A4F6X3_9MICC|nr:RNA methyltransferase [Nesterenkonia natronophila]
MDNPRSERVKRVASLATRAGRKKHRLFLAEGPQPVREALALWLARYEPQERSLLHEMTVSSVLPELDALFFDASAVQRFPDIEALLDRLRAVLFDPTLDLPRGARPFLREATPEVLAAMGDAETSQGLMAVARIPDRSSESRSLESATAAPSVSLIAGMVRVQDPGNVGTIIRTADAAGVDMVVLSSGAADPWAPKVVRSAAGSHFHVPIFTGAEMGEYARVAKSAGGQVVASAGEAEVQLTQLSPSGEETGPFNAAEPTLWLFGNEARGLTVQEIELADHVVAIPIYGKAESLNVATAATICLYFTAMAQHSASSSSGLPAGPSSRRDSPGEPRSG